MVIIIVVIMIMKNEKREDKNMNNLANFLDAKLAPIMSKVSNQRHLAAVRDGLVATIPLTIIGAIFLLIATFPFPQAYVDFMANHVTIYNALMLPFNLTIGLLSIYVSFSIGYHLAKTYNISSLLGGISATLCFLATIGITAIEDGSYISKAYLGGEGMFSAILTSILAVEVMRFCDRHNLKIKLPDSVPQNIGNSFDALLPVTVSVSIVTMIVHIFGFDINESIATLLTPLLSASADSLILPIIYVILTALMWFVGMHPGILKATVLPIWTINAVANMEAYAAGAAIPHVGVEPFIFTFLWIGGGGGTLALCLMMCFSKSKSIKSLGRLSIAPSLFNINEPILFGVPFILNATFFIPLLIGPLINVFITYFAFTSGLVAGMGNPLAAAWNFPSFLAGFLCTNSWTGVALVIVNFLVYFAVYYPFFKIYEKKSLMEERGLENE